MLCRQIFPCATTTSKTSKRNYNEQRMVEQVPLSLFQMNGFFASTNCKDLTRATFARKLQKKRLQTSTIIYKIY